MSADRDIRSIKDRLAHWSVVAVVLTFLLVVLGGVVRVSDSGLGCGPAGSGTQGWPLCNGRLIPLLDVNTIIEYSHRLLASFVAIAALLLLVYVWRRLRDNRTALILTTVALASVLAQAVLGGLAVEENLNAALVAAHLGLAMLLLAMFLGIRKTVAAGDKQPVNSGRLYRAAAVMTVVVVLGTIVSGGYMAGSEGHGRETAHGHGAHYACGNEFPACRGEFLPFGANRDINIHLIHRVFMYTASLLILGLFLTSAISTRYRRLLPMAALGAGFLVLQILLGALNVWLDEKAWLVIAHLTVGTVLWIWIVQFTLNLLPVPQAAVAKASAGSQVRPLPT